MSDDEQAQWLVPTTGAKTLPAIEILTGRGFITGKSGSGKSNSGGVIAEELLENNYNLLVVDPEGEYYGLKEKYEILHVGNDDLCDVQVTANHADQIAEIALERNMPVILDVSDFLDGEQARELIANVVKALFQKEKNARKPFLLMIEEMQEYLPQQGGNGELSELLERVAKRGRKRGLGMLGMSQRPSSVDKDFITQCDWMLWHRLTWQNDVDVVRKVLGSDVASEVEDLDTGEGYLMTDWDEAVERVQFKRKQTHDAGATPGLESYERPDLKSVSDDLVREIQTQGVTGATAGGTADDDANDDADGFDPADQAELNEAVETVEVEGAAITDSPLVEERPEDSENGSGSPAGDGPSDDGSAATETTANGRSETADTSPPGGAVDDAVSRDDVESAGSPDAVDLESMDGDALRDRARALERRNRILEDEVAELRSVLQNVETGSAKGGASQAHAGGAPTEGASTGSSSAGSASTRSASTKSAPTDGSSPFEQQADAGDASSSGPAVSKPVPPNPPVERTGVAGNLVEFVAMMGYVTRSLTYRAKLLAYRLRETRSGDDRVRTN